jgi:hypothetical protein
MLLDLCWKFDFSCQDVIAWFVRTCFVHHGVLCCHNKKFCAEWGNYAGETHEIVHTAYWDNDVFKA